VAQATQLHGDLRWRAAALGVEHVGVSCNLCGESPLRGVRYKCISCPDCDVCRTCRDLHAHRVFVRLDRAIDPRWNEVLTLMTLSGWLVDTSSYVQSPPAELVGQLQAFLTAGAASTATNVSGPDSLARHWNEACARQEATTKADKGEQPTVGWEALVAMAGHGGGGWLAPSSSSAAAPRFSIGTWGTHVGEPGVELLTSPARLQALLGTRESVAVARALTRRLGATLGAAFSSTRDAGVSMEARARLVECVTAACQRAHGEAATTVLDFKLPLPVESVVELVGAQVVVTLAAMVGAAPDDLRWVLRRCVRATCGVRESV
jgi:hypothetical protein